MKRLIIVFATLAIATSAAAQDKVVKNVIEIGTTDNKTMELEDFLSNRIGGRPIGSHSLEDAEKWVASQFKSWGLEVVMQEVGEINVGFQRGPWSGHLLGAEGMELHFVTPTYTSGTKGPQKGHVVLEPRSRRDLDRVKSRLKGAWVLIGGKSNGFPLDWSAEADERRAKIIAQNDSIARVNMEIQRYNREHRDAPKELVPMNETPAIFLKEMIEAGVLGFIQAGDLPLQCLYDRANCYKLTMDNLPKYCDIKLDAHQYATIRQKVQDRQEVILEFDIRNHFFQGPVKYHNVLGIMRGSKYPDEYVITGGHLDAYDGGTGSVDDGQGVCVTMESARLLAKSGAKPKRSIIFAAWTGEEYGLLGSKFFVESGMVPMDKISNYFNRDSGPEVAMSVTVPPAMFEDFTKICKPLSDINPDFPFEVRKNQSEPRPRPTRAGGSDHAHFAMNGVPTISLELRDANGYDFNYRDIWHTESDLYNKCYPDYLEHSSVVNAIVVYGVSNLDHMLSRSGLYSD